MKMVKWTLTVRERGEHLGDFVATIPEQHLPPAYVTWKSNLIPLVGEYQRVRANSCTKIAVYEKLPFSLEKEPA